MPSFVFGSTPPVILDGCFEDSFFGESCENLWALRDDLSVCCYCSCAGIAGSTGFQPLPRPPSLSPSPSLTLSRPTSVLGEKEILYAQLDLTPSTTPFLPEESAAPAGSPRLNDTGDASSSTTSSTSSSSAAAAASASSSTTYAQIDFQKSDGLKIVLTGSR